jgi:predicted Zn-dependent protease
MMAKAGADPRAINAFFERLSKLEGGGGGLTNLFRSHPLTRERIDSVAQMAEGLVRNPTPILDAAEWAALKSICRE